MEEARESKAAVGLFTHKKSGEQYKDKNGNPFITGTAQKDVHIKEGQRVTIFINSYKRTGDPSPDRKMYVTDNDYNKKPEPVANEGDQTI